MIPADGRGEDVRNGVKPVPAIREDHDTISRFAGRDDEGLNPGTVFPVKKEKIVAAFFQAETQAPGKLRCALHSHRRVEHHGNSGFVRALCRRGGQNHRYELSVIPDRRV